MPEFINTTEQSSKYRHLEKMSVKEIITHINNEDKTVPDAVEKALLQIENLILAVTETMLAGGRLFYIGAGTSGRLGILDASECPTTFGVSEKLVTGIIAGGNIAIRKAVEKAEDDKKQGWKDLKSHNIKKQDFVIGLASSGTTPYVVGAIELCKMNNVSTGCIVCNAGSPLAQTADFPVEIITGPEFVTGSTRMKSGTAQKIVLNMISTTVMIKLGRVEDNKMVNMQITNKKLMDRGTKMIMEKLNLKNYSKAQKLLLEFGSVSKAVEGEKKK